MPDASNIESYSGNPNLAFGSSALPAASTDVVLDSSPVIKAWDQYAQNKLAVAQQGLADLKKKQLAADAALRNDLDMGNYKIIPEDYPAFNKLWENLRNDLKQPGVADAYLSGDQLNPDYQKIKSQLDKLRQFSSFSTQQGAHADVTYNDASGNPDKYVDAFGDINKYRGIGDPFKRAQQVLEPTPNISLDFPAYVAKLKSSITPTQKLTTQMVNGRYVDTTETIYDADKIDAATAVDYQTNKKFRAEADEAFGELAASNPQLAQQIGSAQKYASATAYDMLNGGTKVIAKNPYFPPAYTQKDNLDEIGKRKELIYRIQNKDPQALDIFRGLKYQGLPIQNIGYTHFLSPKEDLIQQRDALQKQADGETGKDQKATLLKVADLQKQIDSSKDKAQPTVIQIQTQPTSTDPDGKTINIEVSPETGGGFYAINQFINDLEGQQKLSVEDLSKVPEYKPSDNTQQQPQNTQPKMQPQKQVHKKGDKITIGNSLATIQDVKILNGVTYFKTELGWVDASKL